MEILIYDFLRAGKKIGSDIPYLNPHCELLPSKDREHQSS